MIDDQAARAAAREAAKKCYHDDYVRNNSRLLDKVANATINAYLAALPPANVEVEREACAKVVEPKGPRPCDCDHCDCGNYGSAQAVARWDEATADAAAIRARSQKVNK